LYSVIAYNVAQRTHEIGVRLALGAQRRSVVRLVVTEGLRFSVIGLALGCGIAWFTSRWLAPLLFDEPAMDPTVYSAVTIVLLAVASLASALPALRAASVDPKTALMAD